MANIIIRSDERRSREEQVLSSFSADRPASAEAREAAQCVAARVGEAYATLKKLEDNKKGN